MKKLAFAIAALIISSTAFASPGNSAKRMINYDNISEQIMDQLANSEIAEALSLDDLAAITFMVDAQHRLVLLDVEASDYQLIRDLKEQLRGIELSVDENQVGKVYRIAVQFDVAG